jgi:hypothetical protein
LQQSLKDISCLSIEELFKLKEDIGINKLEEIA